MPQENKGGRANLGTPGASQNKAPKAPRRIVVKKPQNQTVVPTMVYQAPVPPDGSAVSPRSKPVSKAGVKQPKVLYLDPTDAAFGPEAKKLMKSSKAGREQLASYTAYSKEEATRLATEQSQAQVKADTLSQMGHMGSHLAGGIPRVHGLESALGLGSRTANDLATMGEQMPLWVYRVSGRPWRWTNVTSILHHLSNPSAASVFWVWPPKQRPAEGHGPGHHG